MSSSNAKDLKTLNWQEQAGVQRLLPPFTPYQPVSYTTWWQVAGESRKDLK